MDLLTWLIVGLVAGVLASLVMGGTGYGLIGDIVVGIVGAFLGGLLLSPLLGTGTINQNNFSLPGLLVSLVGAVILLAIVNVFRRGTVR